MFFRVMVVYLGPEAAAARTARDIKKLRTNYTRTTRTNCSRSSTSIISTNGVGCNDGWGARTLDKYTIDANKPYSYGFILSCE